MFVTSKALFNAPKATPHMYDYVTVNLALCAHNRAMCDKCFVSGCKELPYMTKTSGQIGNLVLFLAYIPWKA